MTLDVYSDLFDDDLEAVGVALNAALAPSGQNVGTNVVGSQNRGQESP
ncbi:hypothetical protein [Gordonia sp. FQ]